MSTVPVENINKLYVNTEVGTIADPVIVDAAIADIVTTINANWNALVSTIAGSSGAHVIGSALIPGVSGSTIYAQLVSLEQQIQDIQSGVVPAGSIVTAMFQDGSVTFEKLEDSMEAAAVGGLLYAHNNLGGW